jgi:flagellar M-ring protein FliF
MDQLRRVLATIQAYLGKLNVSQQLLIGSVVVMMLMALFVVQQYASKPEMVDLLPAGSSADDRTAAVAFLQANNVPHVLEGGAVKIPPERRHMVISQMASQNALPSDSTILFDNLIEQNNWTLTQGQSDQLAIIAVQNELNRIVTHFPGVRSANVILNIPERRPLGSPRGKASASATIFSVNGLNQTVVDSVAGLIAGSRGIPIQSIRVIDGTTNRQWKAKSGDDLIATTSLELQSKIEERKRGQLHEMLAYIQGVIISVQAQVDVKKVATSERTVPKEGSGSWSPVVNSVTLETVTTEPQAGGEAGARPNTRVDVSGSGAQGAGHTESQTTEEFEPHPGEMREETVDPRGHATKIAAVINIPRSYFVAIWKNTNTAPTGGAESAEGEAEPTDADIQPIQNAEIARIKNEVMQLIDSSANIGGAVGVAEVSMIHVGAPMPEIVPQSAGFFASATSGASPMAGLVKTIGLGVLALFSLGLIVITSMKASKREVLPTAIDLVGIPPALREDSDLVGEALEAESQLEGVELTEDELRHHKQMEQVAEMVTDQPSEAASLLNKWISEER